MDLEECVLVTDITLAKLASNCPNLESLVSFNKVLLHLQMLPFCCRYCHIVKLLLMQV